MSNRLTKGRSHEGKKAYATREKAVSAAQWYEKTYGAKKHAYQCHFCKNWHIGKPLNQTKRRYYER